MNRILIILFFLIIPDISGFSQGEDQLRKRIIREINNLEQEKGKPSDNIILEEIGLADNKHEIPGRYFHAGSPGSILPVSWIYAGRVNSCRPGGCSIEKGEVNRGNSEYFEYLIFVSMELRVLKVIITDYQATHGQEITSRGWLKQFIDYDGSKSLEVGKGIDSISGATVSVNAITEDIRLRLSQLRQLAGID